MCFVILFALFFTIHLASYRGGRLLAECLLKHDGTRLPEKITKYLQGDIWELRPGSNRVMYFYFKNDTYVLLHMFKKKTQKTPKSEIEKAIKECNDYKERNGGK